MFRRLFAEAVGTYLLLVAVGVSNGEPFAVGGALWGIMVLTGFTSNAVFNPAMSVSFILKAHFDHKLTQEFFLEYVLYTVIQFLSAVLGALTAWGIIAHTVHFSIMDGFMDAETFYAELIYTAMLACNAHMMGKLSNDPVIRGGVVAMTVTAGDWAIGKVSGGCFNPAVAFSINLVAYIKVGKHMNDTWIYLTAPVIGAVIGTYLSDLFGREVDKARKAREEDRGGYDITVTLGD